MYKIVYVGFMGLFAFLVYKLLCLLFNIENTAVKRRYNNARILQLKRKRNDYMFAKYVRLPEFRKTEMEEQLYSLGIDMTPEQYVSMYLYRTTLPLMASLSMFLFGIKEIAVVLFIYSGLTFFNNKNILQRALDYRRSQIEEEAPELIRFFLVSLRNSTDLKEIFRSYRGIAKYMKRDISLCVMDMESTSTNEDNIIYALGRLDDRLNTPILSDFISGLINQSLGKNQESYFMILERDLKDLAMNNLMKNARRVEGKIRPNFYILIGSYILMTVAIIVVFIAKSLVI